MEEKKNGNISTLLGLIIICILVGIITFLITNMALNKLDNNSSNNNTTDNNVINENNTTQNIVKSDHITNNKVQAIYDQVKINHGIWGRARYYEDGYFSSLKNKIGFVLTYSNLDENKLSDDNIKYLKNFKDISFDYNHGYISSQQVINKIQELYNIKITKDDFVSIEHSNFEDNIYGEWTEFRYSSEVDGFVYILWGAGDPEYYYTEVYNYQENDNTAYVDTLVGAMCYNPDEGKTNMCNVENPNNRNGVYQNINTNTFKFSEEDKDKFTKIRYTFTKRDDGSYYVSDIKKIN